MSADSDEAPVLEEERVLCPCCLWDNDEDSVFCHHCGEPFVSYPFMGFAEQVYARAKGARGHETGRPSLLLVIPVWLFCLPQLILHTMAAAVSLRKGEPLYVLLSLGFGTLYFAILYQLSLGFLITRHRYREYGSSWTGLGQLLTAACMFMAFVSVLLVMMQLCQRMPE